MNDVVDHFAKIRATVDHFARIRASVEREQKKHDCHPNMVARSIWLTPEMAQKVDEMAMKMGQSRSHVIRRAIHEYAKARFR